jgi:hypothetical protein
MEKHRMKLTENRALKKILRSQSMEIRELQTLCNEKLHDLYSSQKSIKVIKKWRMR